MNIPDILAGFRDLLEPLGVEIYDYMPDAPNIPCVCVYPEVIPYDRTAGSTYVLRCMIGATDMQSAQQQLWGWLSDETDSIVSFIDENNTLDGTVGSVLPVEVRNWGLAPVQEGRVRYLQAELVCEVLP